MTIIMFDSLDNDDDIGLYDDSIQFGVGGHATLRNRHVRYIVEWKYWEVILVVPGSGSFLELYIKASLAMDDTEHCEQYNCYTLSRNATFKNKESMLISLSFA